MKLEEFKKFKILNPKTILGGSTIGGSLKINTEVGQGGSANTGN